MFSGDPRRRRCNRSTPPAPFRARRQPKLRRRSVSSDTFPGSIAAERLARYLCPLVSWLPRVQALQIQSDHRIQSWRQHPKFCTLGWIRSSNVFLTRIWSDSSISISLSVHYSEFELAKRGSQQVVNKDAYFQPLENWSCLRPAKRDCSCRPDYAPNTKLNNAIFPRQGTRRDGPHPLLYKPQPG